MDHGDILGPEDGGKSRCCSSSIPAVSVGRLGSIAGPLLAGALVGQGRSAAQVLVAPLPLLAIAGVVSIPLAARKSAPE